MLGYMTNNVKFVSNALDFVSAEARFKPQCTLLPETGAFAIGLDGMGEIILMASGMDPPMCCMALDSARPSVHTLVRELGELLEGD